MMHIKKEASEAKIKNQTLLQEFASKFEGVEEIQCDEVLSKHFFNNVFISSNFCPIFIYEKKGKQQHCFL